MELLFDDHVACTALLESLRGTVCTLLFTGPVRVVRRGERLFQPGERADALFQLRSGLVKLMALTERGDEIVLELYRPDDVFGEMCFCHEEHATTAVAVQQCEVAHASVAQLRALLVARPELALGLLNVVGSRLSAAYLNLQNSIFDTVLVRVAATLVTLSAALPETGGMSELGHRVSHADLAQMLGVRRETVTRAMGELRGLQLIDYLADGRLRLDLSRLRQYAMPTSRSR